MSGLFPYADQFDENSLYTELKNEVEQNESLSKRLLLFKKYFSRNILLQFFSFFTMMGILRTYSKKESVCVNTFKVVLLVAIIGLFAGNQLYSGVFINTLSNKEYDQFFINLGLTTLLAVFWICLFTFLFLRDASWIFREEKEEFYSSNIKDVVPYMPLFMNKTLNINQLKKFKGEVEEQKFREAFNKNTINIPYYKALIALHKTCEPKKGKTPSELQKEKLQAERDRKIKELYKNL